MVEKNTIYGWVLAGGIAAVGLSIATGRLYHASEPEQAGYAIAEPEGGEGGDSGPSLAVMLAQGDASNGAAIFKKCTACHTIDAGGANGIGPNLHGVLGEAIASSSRGFAFSDALKGVGGQWTFDQMSAWLESPRRFAPGTKMSFAGLSNGQDRADLLLYLNENGSNLPLPTPEEPAEGEDEEEADATAAAPDGEVVAGEEAPLATEATTNLDDSAAPGDNPM